MTFVLRWPICLFQADVTHADRDSVEQFLVPRPTSLNRGNHLYSVAESTMPRIAFCCRSSLSRRIVAYREGSSAWRFASRSTAATDARSRPESQGDCTETQGDCTELFLLQMTFAMRSSSHPAVRHLFFTQHLPNFFCLCRLSAVRRRVLKVSSP